MDEYKRTKEILKQDQIAIDEFRKEMESRNMPPEHIKLALDPMITFALGLKEEIQAYESQHNL